MSSYPEIARMFADPSHPKIEVEAFVKEGPPGSYVPCIKYNGVELVMMDVQTEEPQRFESETRALQFIQAFILDLHKHLNEALYTDGYRTL